MEDENRVSRKAGNAGRKERGKTLLGQRMGLTHGRMAGGQSDTREKG